MAPTVLICDDAIFMRTMVGDILTQAGFEIVGEAETGTQAVERYKALRPDLDVRRHEDLHVRIRANDRADVPPVEDRAWRRAGDFSLKVQ